MDGQVKSIDFISHLDTGQFIGFACINMANGLEAEAAIQNLNGVDHGRNPMKIELPILLGGGLPLMSEKEKELMEYCGITVEQKAVYS